MTSFHGQFSQLVPTRQPFRQKKTFLFYLLFLLWCVNKQWHTCMWIWYLRSCITVRPDHFSMCLKSMLLFVFVLWLYKCVVGLTYPEWTTEWVSGCVDSCRCPCVWFEGSTPPLPSSQCRWWLQGPLTH